MADYLWALATVIVSGTWGYVALRVCDVFFARFQTHALTEIEEKLQKLATEQRHLSDLSLSVSKSVDVVKERVGKLEFKRS